MRINQRIFFNFLILILLLSISQDSFSQYFKVDTTKSIDWLVSNCFLKSDNNRLKIKNISYSGEKVSKGYFIYKGEFNVLPAYGIILGTGNVSEAEGANRTNVSTQNYSAGDTDIEFIIKNPSFDAAKIEFDFMSLSDSIAFSFVFASEEYPEYVKRGVSDAFAFLVIDTNTGEKNNLAKLPNSNIPITVDLINGEINRSFFIDNTHLNYAVRNYTLEEVKFHTEIRHLFEFDGFTKVINTGLKLKPYHQYHFKIVIADVGDRKYDSWVLLKGNSFESCGNIINPTEQEINEYFKHFAIDSIELAKNDSNSNINLLAPIYFDFNSAKLNENSFPILNHLAILMNSSKYHLTINGYADKVGEFDYNLKLSQQRAESVKEYFISKGIDTDRITAIGKGIINADNDNLSRKVEFVFK